MRFLAVALLALLLSAVALTALHNEPAQAYEGMPRAYRAYWGWVSALNGSGGAVEEGVELLYRYPQLKPLYLRLARACGETHRTLCEETFRTVRPPDAQTAQYQQAALALLDADGQAATRWAALAQDPMLEPALVRLTVEHGGGALGENAMRARWQAMLAEDSARVAPAFGLALLAIAGNDWAAAERLLLASAQQSTPEPEVLRELGRVYFVTGRSDKLEETLLRGIAAAEARYDYEGLLVLRGNLAVALLQRGTDLDRAERLLTDALAQSRQLASAEGVALNLYRLGMLRAQQLRYDQALVLLDSAQAAAPADAARLDVQVRALRGTVEWALFRFSDARATLLDARARAVQQGMVLEEVQASVSLAQLYHRMGRHADARAIGVGALEQATHYGLSDAAVAARLVLGDTEAATGNMDQAVAHYRTAAQMAREQGNRARFQEATTRMGQAMLDLKDAASAAAYLEQALKDAPGDARVYEGLGRLYHTHGNYTRALELFALGLRHAGNDPAQRATLHVNALWAYLSLGDYRAAQQSLREAKAALARADEQPQAAFFVASAEAAYLYETGAYAEAKAAFENALALTEKLEMSAYQWHQLHGIALSAWRLGQRGEAERAFRGAIALVEALRDNLHDTARRATFIQDKVLVYKNFVSFLDEQGRTAEAFHYAERVRSRGLADLFTSTLEGRDYDARSPEMRLVEARRRQQALSSGLEELYATATPTHGDQVRASQLRREFGRADSLYRTSLAGLAPEGVYAALARPVEVQAVQQALRPDEALVLYTLGASRQEERRDDVRAFVITATQVQMVSLPGGASELRRGVAVFRDQISTSGGRPGRGWESTSRQLYARLMAPVIAVLPAGVQHLNIVPEAELHYLPFAALRDSNDRFLVERFSLSTVPSASIFCLTRARGAETRGRWRRVVAVADPEGQLPGARREVRALADIKAIRVDALVGAQATEENLRLLAPEADILHVATHGRFNARAPWASALELHGGELSVAEVGQIGLDRPYLVVLSACETALGSGTQSDVPPGDEWVSLNQAFLAAGAPSVMASLWPISDRVSSTLVSRFYNALLDAEAKATALAQVQRAFIHDPDLAHPYYWAAFSLSGDPL